MMRHRRVRPNRRTRPLCQEKLGKFTLRDFSLSRSKPRSKRLEYASLCGLEQRRSPGAKLFEQRRFASFCGREVAQLDVAEAADFFRDRREADRKVMIVGSEAGEQLIKQRFVVAHQLPLGLALRRVTERIERGAAQELRLREQSKHREHPWSEAHFARLAGNLVAPGEERRREVESQTQIVAVDLVPDLPQEAGV